MEVNGQHSETHFKITSASYVNNNTQHSPLVQHCVNINN